MVGKKKEENRRLVHVKITAAFAEILLRSNALLLGVQVSEDTYSYFL